MDRRAGAVLLALAWAAPAAAHEFSLTDVVAVLKSDGTYLVDLRCDLDALALGVSPATDPAEVAAALRGLPAEELEGRIAGLAELFRRRVRLRFDGEPGLPEVAFPERGTDLAAWAPVPSVLGLTARLSGRVPDGSSILTLQVSRSFPPAHLTVFDEASATAARHLLEAGEESPPVPLGRPLAAAGPERLALAGRYLALGFWHIVPEGLDHILFVLGLFLLSPRLKPLAWQVTAFTAAHTVTLALAAGGVVSLPARVVEPLIALSIVYVAVENTLTSRLQAWRPAVVFGFGLLHGLGFAGALAELGLPEGELVTPLLAFNLGVELGQLAVLAAAFATVGWLRDRPWYRSRVAIPASLAIAAVGLFWAVERALA